MLSLTFFIDCIEKYPQRLQKILEDPKVSSDEDLMYEYKEQQDWVFQSLSSYLEEIKTNKEYIFLIKSCFQQLELIDKWWFDEAKYWFPIDTLS